MTQKTQFLADEDIINQLPLFYQPKWLNIVCGNNWDVVLSRDVNKKIVGIFVFILEQKGPLVLLRTPKLTPYFGLYLLPNTLTNKQLLDWEEQHINTLIQQLPKFSFCEFCTAPTHTNFINLQFLGFTQKAFLTYYINLQIDEKELFENISTRTKRYIKNNVNFIVKLGIDSLKDVTDLHKQTFKKQGIKYPYNSLLINQLIENGNNQHYGKLHTLYNINNELVAFLWVAYDATTMYQILSSYNSNLAGQEAMAILTWNAIKDAKKMNLMHYDFEGSVIKGIEHFFRKFGGDRKIYFNFEKNNSMLWRLKKLVY